MRDTLVGATGTLATLGLGDLNLVVAITAGLLTCVYMAMSIAKEARRK
tara:strand:- start:1868 stop:2011 length:144 start_codon:yes stop_codon:yes gene_type:complete